MSAPLAKASQSWAEGKEGKNTVEVEAAHDDDGGEVGPGGRPALFSSIAAEKRGRLGWLSRASFDFEARNVCNGGLCDCWYRFCEGHFKRKRSTKLP